jgi:myo-inositol-1(or 4)-monophosphatase
MENDLSLATEAAWAAGQLLRAHFGKSLVVDEALHHDIKLALDKESQDLITKILLSARPSDALRRRRRGGKSEFRAPMDR